MKRKPPASSPIPIPRSTYAHVAQASFHPTPTPATEYIPKAAKIHGWVEEGAWRTKIVTSSRSSFATNRFAPLDVEEVEFVTPQ